MMAVAGSPSLRELRARIIQVLKASNLPGNPTIVSCPTNPSDQESLPEIHVFDGGRNSTRNSSQKAYRGSATLAIGIEITVQMKRQYADMLDQLTDDVLTIIFNSDDVLQGIGNIEGYNTRPEFERAELPLARNIITVTMSTQESFKPVTAGNPAALSEVKATIETSSDPAQNNSATFRPEH